MEVFGVGPAELVLILVIVLVIFGPDQLPEIAKKLGEGVRELRHALDALSSEVDETVKPLKDLVDPNLLNQSTPAAPPAGPNLIAAAETAITDRTLPGAETVDHTAPAPEVEAETVDHTAPAPGAENGTVAEILPVPELPRDDSPPA